MRLDNCPNDLPDKKTANRWNDSDKNVVEITCHHQRFLREKRSEVLKLLTGDLILDDIPVGSIWSEYMQECRELQTTCKRPKKELAESCYPRKDEMPKTILFTQYNEKVTKQLLAAKKQVTQKSMLAKWNPQLDYQGMIHSNSRLRFAENLPYDPDFP